MRIFTVIIGITLSLAAHTGARADLAQREMQTYLRVQQIINQFSNVNDQQVLFDADRIIESAWQDLVYYAGPQNVYSRDLALIRARSASSRKDKSRVAKAWEIALKLQPEDLPATERLTLNIAAANATGNVGDIQAASSYFAAARTYAFAHDKGVMELQLQLRLQELQLIGQEFPWRRLNDSLHDMRNFSEGFSMWTLPRLDALLGEAELRLALEPEHKEKRKTLADLKAKIVLLTKGMDGNIPPTYIERVRAFYYAIEDNYNL